MKTRSRALGEWRRQARRSWQQLGARDKGVVLFARTVDRHPRLPRASARGETPGSALQRFLMLLLILLGCIAWLVSLTPG